ncbi:MAG: ComF family protein [Candidatus Magasanikbacteria bacterium]
MSFYQVKSILNVLVDAFFPKFCLFCSKEGRHICKNCIQELDKDGVLICPDCKQESGEGELCDDCSSSIDKQTSFLNYKEDKIKKIIRKFKYEYVTGVLDPIKPEIRDFLQKRKDIFPEESKVVPIPLHKKKRADRGFNQAKLIGEIVSNELDLQQINALKRVENTKKQADLKKEERLENVKGVFDVEKDIKGPVILVDDVFTTGATLQECASVLKSEADVEHVVGFTLARGG